MGVFVVYSYPILAIVYISIFIVLEVDIRTAVGSDGEFLAGHDFVVAIVVLSNCSCGIDADIVLSAVSNY